VDQVTPEKLTLRERGLRGKRVLYRPFAVAAPGGDADDHVALRVDPVIVALDGLGGRRVL
jgi:hypothetical protein